MSVRTSTSGARQPSKSFAGRQMLLEFDEPCIGIRVDILRPTTGKRTATAEADVPSRFINVSTAQTSTTGTKVICELCVPPSASVKVIKDTIDNDLEDINEAPVQWDAYDLYLIKKETISVPRDKRGRGSASSASDVVNVCHLMPSTFQAPNAELAYIPSYAILPKIDAPLNQHATAGNNFLLFHKLLIITVNMLLNIN
jgi:hypothetical protein